jgi:hypothetical protein
MRRRQEVREDRRGGGPIRYQMREKLVSIGPQIEIVGSMSVHSDLSSFKYYIYPLDYVIQSNKRS